VRGPARLLALVLLIGAIAPVGLARAGEGDEERPGPCPIVRAGDQGVRDWVRDLIRCATSRWDVPGGAARATCVAQAESGLDPKTVSDDGSYVGLFQHSAEAWPDRYRAWTRPAWQLDERPLNARTNVIVTVRMVNADGWGPWRGVGDCWTDR
jgi:hypothetical protein